LEVWSLLAVKGLPVTATLIVLAVVIIVVLVVSVLIYNRLARRRDQVDNAWSQIDVQLKRRSDLIPNLAETVTGYAGHERGTLEAVTEARTRAINARGPADQATAESALTGALKSLFAVAESYPDLRASQSFLELQQELSATEDRSAYARQYYNDSVLTYNNAVTTVPQSLFAAIFNFRPRAYFQAGGEERGPVRARF
jgi:LemA protein